jgi:signal transduction histidine kinase
MKLLNRISRSWLLFSAIAFVIAGIALFILLNILLSEDIDENLLAGKGRVVQLIKEEGIIPDQPPFTRVEKLSAFTGKLSYIHDTIMFDSFDKEDKLFRELVSVESINGYQYRITIRNALVEESDLMAAIGLSFGAVFLLLLAGLFLINKKISRSYWLPFYKTLDEIKKFTHESKDFSLSAKTEISEFIELNETLEKLTKRIQSDYRSLKRFTEDASHEMQTPLAIAQSRLESLMQDKHLKKEESEDIGTALAALGRLSRLTRTLLLIAKIENRQFPDKEEFNLSVLVDHQIDSLKEILAEKNIETKIHTQSQCILNANLFLTESIVSNLVGNSIKHGRENSSILIVISKNYFSITNSGAPRTIAPEKLFERFYKLNKSSESFGLGLSIVKKICEINRWDISYINENELHTVSICFN